MSFRESFWCAAAQRNAIFNAKFTSPNFAQLAIIADEGEESRVASARSIHHAFFFAVISTGWLIRIFVILRRMPHEY